jgi:pyrimidine operon attenuation protein/uracil phosphoribosyltransferase
LARTFNILKRSGIFFIWRKEDDVPLKKATILTKEEISRAITRISHEILEKNKDSGGLAIVGIRSRGFFIAERISVSINNLEGKELPVGALDITLYRDDLSVVSQQPMVHKTEIDFDIEGKNVILVDDVLYTGRTIRCALDALIDFGRPKTIQLAVLVDRGHRELPIRADYVGKNLPTSQKEAVQVKLEEMDGEDIVFIEADEA